MFEAKRKAFMERMDGGVAIIRSGSGHERAISYRQDSNFYYLTGFEEPESICVLAPEHKEHQFILFVPPRDPNAETWTGRRAGPEGAVSKYGADAAYSIEQLQEKLPEYIKGCKTLYYSSGADSTFDEGLLTLLKDFRSKGLAPRQIVDTSFLFAEMRVVKTEEELERIRKAAHISALAYREVLKALEPDMNEYEIQAVLNYTYQQHGSQRNGYPPIVGSGPNATILHYSSNNRQMQEGELLLIDSACEYEYYSADITRTYPVSGRFSQPQRALYEIVLRALQSAIDMVKPGITLTDIHNNTLEVLTGGLVELGLLQGDVKELIEKKAYMPFYMHGTGHWLGLDVHDAGPYKRGGLWEDDAKLEPGMVFTIEPGLYISDKAEGVDPQYWNIGIRIEDNIIVTADGCEVLTLEAPKEIADIERSI